MDSNHQAVLTHSEDETQEDLKNSHINDLPMELIREIFVTLDQGDRDKLYSHDGCPTARLISGVCRFWRFVALNKSLAPTMLPCEVSFLSTNVWYGPAPVRPTLDPKSQGCPYNCSNVTYEIELRAVDRLWDPNVETHGSRSTFVRHGYVCNQLIGIPGSKNLVGIFGLFWTW
ncbi:uncharacterized protein EI90DRAFT_3067760 [Cantharellus anzutake]|uniref:uncharacterized protein n=1 Tax=Cantharellus anzutake TaxID=1750568 RepID=UPI00190310F3|nr:uncharacterized protein EI90DRAFT_3067760 [Cantharellus anzutake]KAF8327436.1 hypothetical protein EI90DRAFT_3067760 [Cantharellus anzutake]